MQRRELLASAGAVTAGALAGCLTDEVVREYNGQEVVYIPVDEAHREWEAGETLFVDARSVAEFAASHIPDAVASPAPSGLPADDPVEEWPTDDPIIVYCSCPYSLSVQRGAALLEQGYTDVRGLDNGFDVNEGSWVVSGYPTESGEPESADTTARLEGRARPAAAGERVVVRAGGLETYTHVRGDGTYVLSLHAEGLTDGTPVVVEAPGYTVEAPLASLTGRTVTRELA